MTRHLCISVTFLDPLFHGKRDGREPEWPPSPMRLFQALLAGSRTGYRNRKWSESHEKAFRWIERQKPPLIIAPSARRAPACTLFVPNNDSDKAFDRQDRLTTKIAHPHRLIDGDTLHYVWPFDEASEPSVKSHPELLCREARRLLAMGWGIDQVVGNGRILSDSDLANIPGERWRAHGDTVLAQARWRTPCEGSLDDLCKVHQSFLRRVNGRWYRPSLKLSRFATVTYRRATDLPFRPFAAFALRPVDPDYRRMWRALRRERAVCVAAMLRHAAWEAAKNDLDPGGWRTRDWAEQYVAGHGPRKPNGRFVDDNWPRFSYLPLPTIRKAGPSDGMIRRVLIAEPLPQLGGDGRSGAWARMRLATAVLREEQTGRDEAVLEPLSDGDSVLPLYVPRNKPAQEWVSVTPVILPGYDDAKPAKRERLLRECLMHAGYEEAVESIEARSAAWVAGCPPTQTFRRPVYLRNLPAFHVRIRFRAPTAGPVALGAGRHCGLGVFAVT